jgi:transposase
VQIHGNARLVPRQRRVMCQRVRDDGWTITDTATAFGVSTRTVQRWLCRYDAGEAMTDRSSAPHARPTKTPRHVEALIEQLRRARWTAPRIAAELEMATSTVCAVLQRIGLNRLWRLEPPEPANRYCRRHPGELIHIDIKSSAASRHRGCPPTYVGPATAATAPAVGAGTTAMSPSTTPPDLPTSRSSTTRPAWPVQPSCTELSPGSPSGACGFRQPSTRTTANGARPSPRGSATTTTGDPTAPSATRPPPAASADERHWDLQLARTPLGRRSHRGRQCGNDGRELSGSTLFRAARAPDHVGGATPAEHLWQTEAPARERIAVTVGRLAVEQAEDVVARIAPRSGTCSEHPSGWSTPPEHLGQCEWGAAHKVLDQCHLDHHRLPRCGCGERSRRSTRSQRDARRHREAVGRVGRLARPAAEVSAWRAEVATWRPENGHPKVMIGATSPAVAVSG